MFDLLEYLSINYYMCSIYNICMNGNTSNINIFFTLVSKNKQINIVSNIHL